MNTLKKTFLPLALFFSIAFLSSCQPEEVKPETEPAVTEAEVNAEMNEDITEERFTELLGIAETEAGQDGDRVAYYAFDGEFEIIYEDMVRISVGGALYNGTTGQWLGGGAAGSHQISPEVFAELQNSLTHHVRIQIQHSWFFLRQIKLTFRDKNNQVINGLYNANNGDYLFLGLNASGGMIGNTPCGAIGAAAITGRLSANQTALNHGKFGMGFIAGCGPILLSAGAEFGYQGIRIQ